MKILSSSCLLLSSLSVGSLAATFDLSQLHWTLKNQNGSIGIPASGPPTHVHLDLVKAGIITEPLLGINDYTQRWVSDDDWTYTADLKPFQQKYNGQGSPPTLLVFYGVDTIANITLRGEPVAWVNNQFRKWTFDVSKILASKVAPTDNNLTISFESAYRYALNVSKRPDVEDLPLNPSIAYEYPTVWPWIRKVADDFGWDWGPAFVPVGVHKPAYFITLPATPKAEANSVSPNPSTFSSTSPATSPPIPDAIFLEESSIDIHKPNSSFSNQNPSQSSPWLVNVSLAIRTPSIIPSSFLSVDFPDLGVSKRFQVGKIPVSMNETYWVNGVLEIPDNVPQRWYPHNLATGPKLYDIHISLTSNSHTLLTYNTRTGFRTIILAQTAYLSSELSERGITPGDQWHFEINGLAFYAKGTNLIPFDPFYSRVDEEKVRWVLESVKSSGQNMLRVWGGGTYQPSSSFLSTSSSTRTDVYSFYSLCDELGILTWSELIFSAALYPINDFMLDTIVPEVQQNVRRTNRHPSMAQWAGGNEIEGLVLGVGGKWVDEFVKLFADVLFKAVTSETKSVPYTACSTTHGVLSLDPYVLRFNNGTWEELYGNAERFGYDAYSAFNYDTYPISRFVNEFGFHSMPSFYTWEEVLDSPSDFSFDSLTVRSRTHHPPAGNLDWPNPNAGQGIQEMVNAVQMWLPAPPPSTSSSSNQNQTFAQWCYSTQVFQTLIMTSEVAFYRRGAGESSNNLGGLIWQLNDIWQGVSWSAIEFSGRWKVLNYGLTRIYSPVIIYPFWVASSQNLKVMTISDRLETVEGEAMLSWYDWKGGLVSAKEFKFKTPALNNSVLVDLTGMENVLPEGRKEEDVWMLLNATATLEGGRKVVNEQYFTPTSLANANLVDPKINLSRGKNFTFTLSAKGGVAPWTWMDHPFGTVGVFVDVKTGLPSNGFYLVPGIDRTLRFELNPALSKVKNPDPEKFVVRSLWDNKQLG